jgi:two-component system, OmpR family, sensor histidine kinase TctE
MSGHRTSLRSQLLRWLLIPLVVLFVIDAAGSYFLATRISDRVYDGELTEIARELALHVRRDATGLSFDLESDAERTLLLDDQDRVYYAVHAADRGRIAGNSELAPRTEPGSTSPFFGARVEGNEVRVVQFATNAQGSPGAPVVVQVAETLNKRRALAREILADVIIPQLLLIVIAGVFAWIGIARGLWPLQNVRHAIAARSHLDLSPVSTEQAPAEVYPLLQAINDLMGRLDEVLSFQNRFIADAAHQLRTPVAGLKAHIEVALREDDLAHAKHSLAHIYTSVERLSRLVAQLLSLARNEPATVKKVELVAVDLGKLAFDLTTDWVPEAYRKRIDLGFEGTAHEVSIRGDAARLTDLVNNLLDNAVRYTREGGRVTVRVVSQPTPRVSISDDGPTIPQHERGRVFERFHRLLGTHQEGSGLGLAIVREIAELHGAEIVLDDDSDGIGNTFTVCFPCLVRDVPSLRV